MYAIQITYETVEFIAKYLNHGVKPVVTPGVVKYFVPGEGGADGTIISERTFRELRQGTRPSILVIHPISQE